MTSPAQSAASRANGAKSLGPVTQPGKASSAQNSLSHGLTAKQIVLPNEDPAEFERHRAAYIQRFQPADQPELDLVESLAASRWRLNRAIRLETRLMENEPDVLDLETPEAILLARCAQHEKSLALLMRYEGQLSRAYDRTFKQLQILQRARPAGPPQPAPAQPAAAPPHQRQNEPTPIREVPLAAAQPARDASPASAPPSQPAAIQPIEVIPAAA